MSNVQYPLTIDYVPFPVYTDVEVRQSSTPPSTNNPVSQALKLPDPKPFPMVPLAYDILSTSLDTKRKKILGDYDFGENGSLRAGRYENGVSGEVVMTPDGITSKNVNGETTMSLDGTTGNASFAGTIQAGAVIAGAVEVGSSSVQIDGANGRIITHDGVTNRGVFGNV